MSAHAVEQAVPARDAVPSPERRLSATLRLSPAEGRLGHEANRSAAAVGGVLQRACACGGVPGPDGECAQCKARRLALQRAAGPAQAFAQPVVHDALRSPGRPLDARTRPLLEAGLGADLGDVRVHTDATAAASARAVDAVAYTVGSHVVFGAGRYEPATEPGRRLLTHELVHVLQQRQTAPSAGALAISADAEAEREAEAVAAGGARPAGRTVRAVQRQAAPGEAETPTPELRAEESHPAGAHAESPLETGPAAAAARPAPTETPVAEPLEAAAAVTQPAACEPSRALTWADFAGTPSGPATFGAKTVAPVVEVASGGSTTFQARFDSRRSWVRPRFSAPTNRAATSCRSQVQECERFFRRLPAGQTGDWHFSGDPDPNCAAAIVPDATPSATTRAECDSVIGAECDRAAGLESQRLLRHEQLHFDIACQIARKANAALAAGTALATVRSAVSSKAQPAQDQYDADSTHGCDATGQSTWETSVSGGLTSVTIP